MQVAYECKREGFIVFQPVAYETKLVLIVISNLLKSKHLFIFLSRLYDSRLAIFGAAYNFLQWCIQNLVQYLRWSFLCENSYCLQAVTIFAKSSILDVWRGSEYTLLSNNYEQLWSYLNISSRAIRPVQTSLHWTVLCTLSLRWTVLLTLPLQWSVLCTLSLHWSVLCTLSLHWTVLCTLFLHWTVLFTLSLHWSVLCTLSLYWTILCPLSLHWTVLLTLSLHWTVLFTLSLHWSVLCTLSEEKVGEKWSSFFSMTKMFSDQKFYIREIWLWESAWWPNFTRTEIFPWLQFNPICFSPVRCSEIF